MTEYKIPIIRERAQELETALHNTKLKIDECMLSDAYIQASTDEERRAVEKAHDLEGLETQLHEIYQRISVINADPMHDNNHGLILQYLEYVSTQGAAILRGSRPPSGTVAEYVYDATDYRQNEARRMIRALK